MLTTNIGMDSLYCGKMFSFLNKILQESVFPQPVAIPITLVCFQNIFILWQEFPHNIIL